MVIDNAGAADFGVPDSLAWSPDGTQLVAPAPSNGLLVLDAADGTTRVIDTDEPVTAVAWSPDGRTVAASHTWFLSPHSARRRDDADQRHMVVGEQDRPGATRWHLPDRCRQWDRPKKSSPPKASRTCTAGAATDVCSRTRGSPAAGSMRRSRPIRSRSVAAGRWCPRKVVPPIRERGGLLTANDSPPSSNSSTRNTIRCSGRRLRRERTRRPSLPAPTTGRSRPVLQPRDRLVSGRE